MTFTHLPLKRKNLSVGGGTFSLPKTSSLIDLPLGLRGIAAKFVSIPDIYSPIGGEGVSSYLPRNDQLQEDGSATFTALYARLCMVVIKVVEL